MEIKILHLYYDVMNLYGEYGNIRVLEKHLKDQSCDIIVDRKTVGDVYNLNDYDFIYIGHGMESSQLFALKDLLNHKDEFKKCIDDERVILLTGNSYEMLGEKIDEVEALKIFNFETKILKDRVSSDVIYKSKYFENKVVGFVNRMSNIIHNNNPLFEVEFGIGESEGNDKEGIKYKNLYGTHISGPLLARNPEVLKEIVTKICINKDKNFKYKDIEYKNEEEGYKLVLSELEERKNESNI